jgi:glycosyltransferase involved in cell wall biosynthesis
VGAPVANWDWVLRVGRQHIEKKAIVYGRGNPPAGLVAACRLSRAIQTKPILHFSDPLPSPWDDEFSRTTRRSRVVVSEMIRNSALLTFTTPEAVRYMSDTLGVDLSTRAHVVLNIVPHWPRPEGPEPNADEIVYVGHFGGKRRPELLFEGIQRYAKSSNKTTVRTKLVGTSPHWFSRLRRLFPCQAIQLCPRTSNAPLAYSASAITAVIDADDSRPVFLATKTAEAIHAAHRVLIISPIGSPARRLFADRWASVSFAVHDATAISVALERLSTLSNEQVRCEQQSRYLALTEFRPSSVARNFIDRLRHIPGMMLDPKI